MTNYVTVENIPGTSEDKPKDGSASWLDFWKKEKGAAAVLFGTKCLNKNCKSEKVLGAHVEIVGEPKKQYIVPLCDACNKLTEPFDVPQDAPVSIK